MNASLPALAIALCAATAAPAVAQTILHEGIPAWTPEGSGVSINVRGRLVYDIADVDLDFAAAPAARDEADWRAARIGVELQSGEIKTTLELDFAGGDVQLADVSLDWTATSALSIKAGYFKEVGSLEETTSGLATTFMERGQFTDAFDIARRIGIGAFASGERWTLSGVVQGGKMDGLDLISDYWSTSARATFAPVLDAQAGRFVHLGAWTRYRERGDIDDPLFRYRARPLSSRAPATAATARFGETDVTFGLESAAGLGPVYVQAEYAWLRADGPAGDADLDGGFVQLGWMVTRERRPYDASRGRFGQVKPARAIGKGIGAVELALRWDTVDLSDGFAAGGRQTGVTLGGSWRPTAHARISAEYTDAETEGGPLGGGDAEILQTRLQFDW